MTTEQPTPAERITLALLDELTQRVTQVQGGPRHAWGEGLKAAIAVLGWAMIRFADAEGTWSVDDVKREETWRELEASLRTHVSEAFLEVLGFNPTEEGSAT